MNKIPVFATAVAAYRFAIANYLRILGVSWVAMALIGAVAVWLFFPVMQTMLRAVQAHDPAAMTGLLGRFFLLELALFLLFAIPTVGVNKLVLGRPVTWPCFYVSLGGDYWRLVLAYVLIGVVGYIALVVIAVGLTLAAIAVAGLHGAPPAGKAAIAEQVRLAQFVILPFVYAAMAFLFVRFAVLLPPIVIGEKVLGLGRNWKLTRGNSWRILGVILLIMVPLLLLGLAQVLFLLAVGGPDYFGLFGPEATRLAVTRDMMQFYADHAIAYALVWLAAFPIAYGPLLASSSLCYRAIVGESGQI
ncbi:MAG TPA: hypothetical protein VGB91_17215 [Rhizomicrobium sp.]